eukprot:9468571-Pyramimonas_sp.AAC.1
MVCVGPSRILCVRSLELFGVYQILGVALADWNNRPDELMKTGYPELLDADFLPPSCKVACDQGSGTLIDYVLISKGFKDFVSLEPELE